MRTADRIASRILAGLEEQGIKFPKKNYLTCECIIADEIINFLKEEE